MDPRQLVALIFQVSIMATVFGFGLKAMPGDLLYVLRRPGLFLRSLLAVFVVMPVLAMALAQLFDFRRTVEIALIALALSPVPPLLPGKEAKGGGHAAFGLGLLAWLALLSIVAIPLGLQGLERLTGRPLGIAPGAIAVVALKSVLAPLFAGILVRAVVPAVAGRLAKPIATIAKALLLLAVLALLWATFPALWALVGEGTLLAMATFVVAGLAIGHVLGGPDPDHAVVLALSTASRHPAIALTIAAANFPDVRFGGAVLLYLLVNAIVGT
ncbi:MAG TPA: hypothetical protein VLE53_20050, partial [Gemmatimonadaceae bacterium]|nr:hypothetical protein [Gemmatimonadaceae bacterium]